MRMRVLLSFGHMPEELSQAEREKANRVATAIGQKFAKEDVTILITGSKDTPAIVAGRAFLEEVGEQIGKERLITYLPRESYEVRENDDPKYIILGQGFIMDKYAWQRRERLVDDCDVMLLMGGGGGTEHRAVLASRQRKPVVPIPQFGGAADREFVRITNELERSNDKETLRLLRAVGDYAMDAEETADAAIKAALWLRDHRGSNRTIFLAIPFEDYEYGPDVEDAIRDTAKSALDWEVVVLRDIEIGAGKPLTQMLPEQIRKSGIVIVDLNNSRPNVYYEAGLAHGFGRPTIFLAHEGTEVHFNVADQERIEWNSYRNLKERLHKWLIEAAGRG